MKNREDEIVLLNKAIACLEEEVQAKMKSSGNRNASFEYVTTLEYRLKAVNAQIHAFKSDEMHEHAYSDTPKRRTKFI